MAKYDLTNATPFNEQPLYKQGYEDAVDKACEWLFLNIGLYINEQGYVETNQLERDFRKIMEEEI